MREFDPSLVTPGTISFIRHGERASKAGDAPLTPRGIEDSKSLGSMVEPTIVLTSPKGRTVQTAEGISGGRVPVVELEILRSNIYNDRKAYEALVEVHGKGPVRQMWRRGELPPEIIDPPEFRVRRILEEVIGSTSEDDAVIAVTHHFMIPLIPYVMEGRTVRRVGYLGGLTLERSEIVGWLDRDHPHH